MIQSRYGESIEKLSELIPYAKHEEAINHIMAKHQKNISDFSQNFGDQEWRKSIKSKRY
jgi:serine protease inhibitor